MNIDNIEKNKLKSDLNELTNKIKEKLDPDLVLERAELLFQLGQIPKSICDFFLATSLLIDLNNSDILDRETDKINDKLSPADRRKFEKEIPQLLDDHPKNQLLYLLIAKYFQKRNNFTKASIYFKKAIAIDVTNFDAHNQFVKAYIVQKLPRKALDYALKLVKKYPNESDAYVVLAHVYLYTKKTNDTLDNFQKALELNPNNYKAYHNRSIYYIINDNPEKAILDLNQCTKLLPNKPEYYDERGYALCFINRHIDALNDFSKAIELCPNDGMYYSHRAEAYFRLDQLENALNDINIAIKLESEEPTHFALRGYIHEKMGNEKQKNEDLYKAMMLGKKKER